MTTIKLRALLEAATPGPWKNAGTKTIGELWPSKGDHTVCIAENLTNKDADLITEAVNALPALLDRLDKLEAFVQKLAEKEEDGNSPNYDHLDDAIADARETLETK